LDLEGLGDKTAGLLVEEGLVQHLPDLFELRPEQLEELEGFAEKSARNLVEGIERASHTELHRFLFGLGIPEVGVTVARDLARHFRSLEALRQAGEEALQEVEGVGPRMATQIAEFFREPRHREILDRLLAGRLEIVEQLEEEGSTELAGKRFVLTGTLQGLTRGEAKRLLESLGAKVTGTVSAKTDFLVAGSQPGSKVEKARELGVRILDESALMELVDSRRVEA
jgi:DNA ligase (NAD+)